MSIQHTLVEVIQQARTAASRLRKTSTKQRNDFLQAFASALQTAAPHLRQENDHDLAVAKTSDLSVPLLNRLTLDTSVTSLTQNPLAVMALPDPLAAISDVRLLPNGLRVEKRREPLGVLLLIYEARPNATIEATSLAIKSGNAIILKGGHEAQATNRALGEVIKTALQQADLPDTCAQVVTGLSHSDTVQLLHSADQIDLCIPRGGQKLLDFTRTQARMPVLMHGPGVCHVYVDQDANLADAILVALNSKLHRPATCNAAECLLVHHAIAETFLPQFASEFFAKAEQGEMRGCEKTCTLLAKHHFQITQASQHDYATEYLANILNVKMVESLDEALLHIATYGTHHTEAIMTNAITSAERFCREVDASCVLVNASTRLHDGFELGLGAELGISTTKFHAYGAMGLQALTCEKTVAFGNAHIRR